MAVTLKIKKLPRGGKLIRVTVATTMTRYELAGTILHAKKEGETDYTRKDIIRHMRRLIEEFGTSFFVRTYNEATNDERIDASLEVLELFPEFNRA